MRLRILAVVVATVAALTLVPPAPAAAPWLSTGATSSAPGNNGVKVLGLRYAAHPTFDRVVIDLRGPLPDYRTGYARRFHYEGSGKPIPIRGASGLWVSLTAAGHDAAGNNLYTGPRSPPRVRDPEGARARRRLRGSDDLRLRAAAPRRLPHPAPDRPSRMVIDFRHRLSRLENAAGICPPGVLASVPWR